MQDASSGVLNGHVLCLLLLNRSSGVNWSFIILRAESGPSETRQAERMEGPSPVPEMPHWEHMSFSRLEYDCRDFLVRSWAHVFSSPCPIRPNLSMISLQGWTDTEMTSRMNSKTLRRPNLLTEVCFLRRLEVKMYVTMSVKIKKLQEFCK